MEASQDHNQARVTRKLLGDRMAPICMKCENGEGKLFEWVQVRYSIASPVWGIFMSANAFHFSWFGIHE